MKYFIFSLVVLLSGSFISSAQNGSAEFANEFAFNFYRQISEKDQNLFFSPYSISVALAMTYEGAETETAEIMRKTMHFPEDKEDMRQAFESDKRSMTASPDEKKYIFKIANAVWASKDIDFKQSYFDVLENSYAAPVQTTSFKRSSDRNKARKDMNKWTEKNTEGKIKDLIQENDLSIETIMVLINAVYFKSEWQTNFKEDKTKPGMFHGFENDMQADFMCQKKRVRYYKDELITAVEIPYYGRKSSMYILLPYSPDHFEKLRNSINKAYFDAVLKKAEYTSVELEIPKFKTKSRLYLEDEFKKMGMGAAFERSADFSGMSDESDICIDKIIHQSFIEVKENGTEAAAATAVIMKRETALPPSQSILFKADRPFIYLITDNETGAVIFMGQLTATE